MKIQLFRFIALVLLALFFVQSSFATCGGGGGGGGVGMSNGGGGGSAPTFPVAWKVRKADAPPPTAGLILYWFPVSKEEYGKSSMRESRTLSVYASQCVLMELGDGRVPNYDILMGESKLPVAVLATPDGTPVKKVENKDGKLKVTDVEKVLETEMKQRESAVESQLAEASRKMKAGDNDGAIKGYRAVLEQKCMFPKQAKDAA